MPRKENKNGRTVIAIIICVIVLAYLVYQLCTYLFGTGISLYNVGVGSVGNDIEGQYSAVAIRQETVVTAGSSGYVNFFVGDSTPVGVGDEAYLIDESGSLYEQLSAFAASVELFDDAELADIKNTIYDFDTTFDTDNYYDVYSFKSRLESQLLETIYTNALSSSAINLSSYSIVASDLSGICMHMTDGFEDISADEMEASYFRKGNYSRNIIISNDYVEAGSPVYKVVTSTEWQLVIQIEDASAFSDITSVTVEFLKDGITANCSFYTYTNAGNSYGVLTLDKYMYRYVSDRYLQISISDDSEEGLMIPKTSVDTQQFYVVPASFLTTGGNSSSYGFLVENGNSVQFVVPEIISRTDEYVYVSMDFLSDGDVLIQSETNETYTVREKANIEGVYLAQTSSYSFVPVTIIGENGDYFIVSEDSGLDIHDSIVANAESVSN